MHQRRNKLQQVKIVLRNYGKQLRSARNGKVVKGKCQIKWNGNLEELQSFVDLVLKLK